MTKSRIWLCIPVLTLLYLFHMTTALECESCGNECRLICGTKRFRNCCYNYIKKRSGPMPGGPEERFELIVVAPGSPLFYPFLKNGPIGHEGSNYPSISAGGRNRNS